MASVVRTLERFLTAHKYNYENAYYELPILSTRLREITMALLQHRGESDEIKKEYEGRLDGRQGFYATWMYSRLSHRISLVFIRSRSPLRSFM